ncbi:MAG: MarC family protein [Candidatus Thermoplasmatota archaeon]|jgi:multiple antibiotic resistance protein|nr:MarC family protein [Candidatus Thermoplasmatota archaeon]
MTNLSDFLHIAIELFVVVDPFAAMIMFITFAKGEDVKERRRLVNDATISSFLILLFFAFVGAYILLYFGISIAALEIAGGILILLTSIEMVTEGDKPSGKKGTSEADPVKRDVGIVPLGTPLLAGPGAISLVILLMHDYNWGLVILAIVVVSVITYILFLSSFYIYNIIKEKGARALTRVFGILVAGFAIQYILTGALLFFHIHV